MPPFDLPESALGAKPAPLPRDSGRRRSFYMTMRDGVRVAVDLHLPSRLDAGRKIPTILRQTRYFRAVELPRALDHRRTRDLFDIAAPLRERFLARGYAWADVDVRGSGVSSGTWPVPWSPAEVRDGAEIVDWIVKQPWSNGRVGATGISYDGTTSDMLLVNGHPAVRAVAPRFSLFDAFEDVTFPGGVHLAWFTAAWSRFNRLLDDHRFHAALADLVFVIARARAQGAPATLRPHALSLLERLGPGAIAAAFGAIFRGGRRVDEDPMCLLRDEALRDHAQNGDVHLLCRERAHRDDALDDLVPGFTIDGLSPRGHMTSLAASGAAIFSYGGWLDGAYAHGAIKRFLNIKTPGSRLLLGPWGHGGELAHQPFGPTLAAGFHHDAELLRFFDRHLQGIEGAAADEPPIRYFTFGANRWNTASSWPLPGARPTSLYLGAGRRLRAERPSDEAGGDEAIIDRALGTGERSRWRGLLATFVPADYPDLGARHKGALRYDGDPLERDIEVTGHPIAHIHLRAHHDDATVFVYLEDVAPDGRVQYVTEGQLRALHRRVTEPKDGLKSPVPYHSFCREDASPLEPGAPALLSIPLLPTSYLFRRGHRVRLVITAGDADHFAPPPAALRGFEVMRTRSFPSSIELPIMNA